MNGNFDARLRRLESLNPAVKREEWRAYLMAYFAGSEYDGHREAIIEALSSDTPRYDFERLGLHYHVDWWTRDAPAGTYPGGNVPVILIVPPEVWKAV